MIDTTYKRCLDLLKKYESDRRAAHSLGVYNEACRLCDMMGIMGKERDDVETAAILHDIAHDLPLEEQFKIMDAAGVDYEDIKDYPPVVHQRAGAVLARMEFPELSSESFGIIECHTTGRIGMTTGEKIVCLCDYTEPGREHDGCRAVREYFYTKAEKITDTEQYAAVLDGALKKAFGMTLDHLKAKGYPVHPVTAEVYKLLRSE